MLGEPANQNDVPKVLLKSTDGGAHWTIAPTPGAISDLIGYTSFSAYPTVVERGDFGAVRLSTDGAQSWVPLCRESEYIHVSPAEGTVPTWLCGDGGKVACSYDGGQIWNPRKTPTNNTLSDIIFPDREHGWCVGTGGVILATDDGGHTWKVQASPTRDDLEFVSFADRWKGCISSGKKVWFTEDGGATWSNSFESSDVVSGRDYLKVFDNEQGYFSSAGILYATQDSGRIWSPVTTLGNYDTTYSFWDPRNGVGIGDNEIDTTSDGARTWHDKGNIPTISIHCAFTDESHGCYTDGSTLYSTVDGGVTWTPHPDLGTDIDKVEAGRSAMWALGAYGTLAASFDNGEHWADPRVYKRYAPPWYYLSFVLILPFLYLGLRPPKRVELKGQTIADALANDQPLCKGDYDAMRFGQLASGLSRYLRNGNTKAPLTVAITGEWGSGKSSIMNLLQADLQQYGICSVWFNAWHHQEEENLLAALLDSIQREAIPSLLGWAGIAFRVRLLWRRTRTWYPLILAILFVLAGAVGYFIRHPDKVEVATQRLNAVVDAVHPSESTPAKTATSEAISKSTAKPVTTDAKPASTASESTGDTSRTSTADPQTDLATCGFFLSIISLAAAAIRAMTAFGLKPAELISSLSKQARVSDLQAQTSFRYRFAQQFADVTAALNPRTMVIFIDDLDRCKPENVVSTLETINFLVSSGECFVILGMARAIVENCVALDFKDVATEIAYSTEFGDSIDGAASGEEVAHAQRLKYARNYLEKLVNLEVPVPRPSEDQSGHLLMRPDRPDKKRKKLIEIIAWLIERRVKYDAWLGALADRKGKALGLLAFAAGRRLVECWLWLQTLIVLRRRRVTLTRARREGLANALPFVVMILMPLLGYAIGCLLPGQTSTAKPVSTATAAAQPFQASDLTQDIGAAVPNMGAQLPASTANTAPAATSLTITPGVTWTIPYRGVFAAIGLLAFFGWLRMRIPPEIVVEDSVNFKQALYDWRSFLFRSSTTPRMLKRFVNRVRFYAMRQPGHTRRRSGLLMGRAAIRIPERDTATSTGLPEDILVALSAIEYFHPEWVGDPDLYADFKGYFVKRASEEEVVGFCDPQSTELTLPTFSRSLRPTDREAFLTLSSSLNDDQAFEASPGGEVDKAKSPPSKLPKSHIRTPAKTK